MRTASETATTMMRLVLFVFFQRASDQMMQPIEIKKKSGTNLWMLPANAVPMPSVERTIAIKHGVWARREMPRTLLVFAHLH